MIKADLHIHTDISDGSLTTEEAIKIEKGLKEAIELGKNIRKSDRGCRDSRHLIFYLDFKLFLYCFGETPISRLNIV